MGGGSGGRGFMFPVLAAVAVVVAILIAAVVLVPPNKSDEYTVEPPSHPAAHEDENAKEASRIDPQQCMLLHTQGTSWSAFVPEVASWSLEQRCRPDLQTPKSSSPSEFLCTCDNPVEARGRGEEDEGEWNDAAQTNIELVNAAAGRDVNVVLLGDSITERWQGTEVGQPLYNYADLRSVYQDLFSKRASPNTARVEGLALGIAGDRCPNVLYRLKHGELADHLQPAVWWLLIGTNDYGVDGCNVDCIVAGNVRIAEEILARRPNATVVLNSLFPTSRRHWHHNDADSKDLHAGRVQYWKDYSTVNRALECYAAGRERVEFYNATNLFLAPKQPSQAETTESEEQNGEQLVAAPPILDLDRMPDGLHPDARGFRLWGEQIVRTVLDIMERNARENENNNNNNNDGP